MKVDDKIFSSNCDICVSTLEEYDKKAKEYIGN